MDKIKTWYLWDKVIMEWGGGASSIWWALKSRKVYSVDHNEEWFNDTLIKLQEKIPNTSYCVDFVPTFEGDQSELRDKYVKCYPNLKPNICIVDGVHRYECAEYAVKVLKPEILIVDNHQQDYVFICPALDELLKGVKMERYIQPNHTEHEGRPWATAIFYLNEKQDKELIFSTKAFREAYWNDEINPKTNEPYGYITKQ
jgi:hypothetical protein